MVPIALLLYPGFSLVVKFTVSPEPRIDFYTALLSLVMINSSSEPSSHFYGCVLSMCSGSESVIENHSDHSESKER